MAVLTGLLANKNGNVLVLVFIINYFIILYYHINNDITFIQSVPCCSNVGLLQVMVVEAKDLDKQDLIGKSDPLVECWTQHVHVEATVRAPWNLFFDFFGAKKAILGC